ncbi:DoxX family protein [Nocardia sp. NPDC050697]|uniref:DoxX family protein n=1 Tax=Nocardia sp. NPDC050697 TaxID=3155158 RepID=UPI00340D755B
MVTALLAFAVTGSAAATLTRQPTIVATVSGVGFPIEHLRTLGVLKAVGVVGLCLGLVWAPVAVAAAAGLVGYFAAALVAHLRVRRYDIVPAAVFLALSVAALTLLVGELA